MTMAQSGDGAAGFPATQLDKELALSRAGGDESLLRELAALFLDDYPRTLEQLRKGIAGGIARTIEHHAHSLKGSVSNFGAKQVFDAALAIETKARQGALEDAPELLKQLEAALNSLRPELARLITG